MKWIGTQTIYDNVRLLKSLYLTGDLYLTGSLYDSTGGTGTLPIVAGDITVFNAVNDGDPTISLGSSGSERLEIKAQYESGAQGLDGAIFTTYTAGSSTNDGRFTFFVDQVGTFQIRDHGINLYAGKSLQIGNTDIISDSGGTATLSNIDALDATTISTFNAALTAGDITGVTAGTGLSGGGTSGAVTLNVSGLTVSEIAAGSILVAGETFADNDTSLMSAAAINDRIESFGYTTSTGDITGVRITTDTGGGGIASVASGSADFSILGASGVGVTNSGETITAVAVPGEIDHDSLLNFAADEHFTQANITTVGTIGTGVWQGTAIASAYLDADTAHISATKQMTHHVFVDNMGTTKQYVGLTEADAENTNTANKFLPFPAIVDGKLIKVALRSNKDLTGHTLTWRLESIGAANPNSATPNILGTQSGAGCNNTTMTTYDFTSSLDSGANAFDASDLVYLSVQSNTDFGSNVIYYITCLWEFDLS